MVNLRSVGFPSSVIQKIKITCQEIHHLHSEQNSLIFWYLLCKNSGYHGLGDRVVIARGWWNQNPAPRVVQTMKKKVWHGQGGGCCSARDMEWWLHACKPHLVLGLLHTSQLIFENHPSGACMFPVHIHICSMYLYDLQIQMSQEWPLWCVYITTMILYSWIFAHMSLSI